MSQPQAHAEIPPLEFLQLAGHPLRWQLLTELAHSDRMVHELTELVGEPQNLVSYHLAKLRDGRLVAARRSDADGRDTYYTADLARIGSRLSAAGDALHPRLRAKPESRDDRAIAPVRILFLCTGNSARSQMAEALAKERSHGAIKAFSAGSRPKPLHPNAVRAMKKVHGVDLAACKSKHLDTFAGQKFDWVISMCDRVREVCPPFPGQPEVIHWSIPNPVTGEADEITYPLFEKIAVEVANRIDSLLAVLGDQTPAPSKKRRKKP